MITLTQITDSDEIIALSDYYTLVLESEIPDPDQPEIPSFDLGMLQISAGDIINLASVRISDAEDSIPEEQIASSLARLLIDSTVVAEPPVLIFLRELLDRYEQEGEVFFVPLSKLAAVLFPELPECSLSTLKDYFALEIREADSPLLQKALLTDKVFRRCRQSLSGEEPASDLSSEDEKTTKKRASVSSRNRSNGKKRVSDKDLNQWADRIWTISPWTLLAAVALVVLLLILLLPKDRNDVVDREKAPINYLVLSWDQTGKYGTQVVGDEPIEFRIPYGVYNVLNNNSIPVELTIVNEDVPAVSAKELSASGTEEYSEEDVPQNSTVIIRPNMSREIIIDVGQYLTLSENANELILFYVSEVPEEIESDTTGQISETQAVVYAYVKGTEVRFRSAPSLEGHIIDTLNNGQQVQVLGITGEWTHVSVQDHKGYIFSEFLTPQDQYSPGS